jgi:hypothetical protein
MGAGVGVGSCVEVGGNVSVGLGLALSVDAGVLVTKTTGSVTRAAQPASMMERRSGKNVFFMDPAAMLMWIIYSRIE